MSPSDDEIIIYADVTLCYRVTKDFVWPDNDGPEKVTAANVAEEVGQWYEELCAFAWATHDDPLPQRIKITEVYVDEENPHHAGDEVLFGEAPPKRVTKRAPVR